jgi:hypothetical protein
MAFGVDTSPMASSNLLDESERLDITPAVWSTFAGPELLSAFSLVEDSPDALTRAGDARR